MARGQVGRPDEYRLQDPRETTASVEPEPAEQDLAQAGTSTEEGER